MSSEITIINVSKENHSWELVVEHNEKECSYAIIGYVLNENGERSYGEDLGFYQYQSDAIDEARWMAEDVCSSWYIFMEENPE